MGGKLDQREDGLRIVWMWICRLFVVICILAELVVFIAEIIIVFLYASEINYANTGLDNLKLKGLQEGDAQRVRKLPPFFVAATAFLKLWLVACYESQSFVGLSEGKNLIGEEDGINVQRYCLIAVSEKNIIFLELSLIGGLAATWIWHLQGFILLGSIVPGIAAQVFTYLGVDDDKYYEK
ncbi:hypothetical protein NCC49_006559 [Naganishia albida]|nr:hypothetical protein NCC49_006559 [Naganishia albida]